jgi:hypothetical protein
MNRDTEYYWSLVVESGWVQAGVWTIEDKKARVICLSPSLPWEADEDLVEAANAALSKAVQDLDEEANEPSKTVFGVPPSWVGEGQIKKEYLEKIRMICSKLSLSPSGFVVLPEAIAHAVKLEEGSALTGVVVGLGKSVLDVSVFRFGNLVGTVNVGRSVSVTDDVIEALARFDAGESLPSRFLLYDGRDAELEDVRQVLLKTDWDSVFKGKMKFIHPPQIEIVDPEDKAMAVSLAGASEIGEVEGVVVDSELAESGKDEKMGSFDGEFEDAEEPVGRVASSEPRLAEIGFMVGGDVRKAVEGGVARESLSGDGGNGDGLVKKKAGRRLNIFGLVRRLRFPRVVFFRRMKSENRSKLPEGHLPKRVGKRGIAVAAGVVLFLVVGVLLAAWWYLPEADVVVYVSSKTLEETKLVTFDETARSTDLETMVIPAEMVSVEVSGEKTGSATGEKTVGEKATGVVTVRNGTSAGIKLNAGTVLLGPSDLKFSIAESASVSAATSPSSPGTESLNVSAGDIGAQYNLAKGETLVVGNYPKSEVDALVDEDFTGGSSREIVAVSSEDLEKLEDGLTEELVDEGRDEISSEIGEGKVFIADAVESESVSRDFDRKVGDEASSVRLDLKLRVSGLVVSEEDFNKIGRSVLEPKVPEGFVLRDEQLKTSFDFLGGGDGLWEFDVIFKANLLPEVDPVGIAKKISGRSLSTAERYLTEMVPGYTRVRISVSPALPGKLSVIPRVVKHINVEVTGEK